MVVGWEEAETVFITRTVEYWVAEEVVAPGVEVETKTAALAAVLEGEATAVLTTSAAVATELSDEDEEAAEAAGAVLSVEDVAKLALAVVEASELTVTSFTITTSPSTLVTLISTVVVPNPLEFSKKL